MPLRQIDRTTNRRTRRWLCSSSSVTRRLLRPATGRIGPSLGPTSTWANSVVESIGRSGKFWEVLGSPHLPAPTSPHSRPKPPSPPLALFRQHGHPTVAETSRAPIGPSPGPANAWADSVVESIGRGRVISGVFGCSSVAPRRPN